MPTPPPVSRRAGTAALVPAALALLAACGGSAPDAGASSDAAPAAAGTMTMTLRGPGVDVSGTGPTRQCGGPAFLPPAPAKGVYYEGTVQGHTVAMGDMEQRRAGAQTMLRAGGTGWEGTVNAPGKSYAIEREPAPTVQVGADFKTAEMRATVKPIGEPGQYALQVSFRCP